MRGVTGTLNLLEESVSTGVQAFISTSTSSVFGDGLVQPPDAPAALVTEEVVPIASSRAFRSASAPEQNWAGVLVMIPLSSSAEYESKMTCEVLWLD
jgi:NAD dependent epimerase/dehydratase family